MTGAAPAELSTLLVLTRRPRVEEEAVLDALARGGTRRLTALLVNAAVEYVEHDATGRLPIDWLVLADDARGRGIRPAPGSTVREVDYAEAVRCLFAADHVVGLP